MNNDSLSLAIRFSESPIEELQYLAQELQIGDVLKEVEGKDLPNVKALIMKLGEMFSLELPDLVNQSVPDTLRRVSRDNNLSKILRERAYMLVFRLLETVDGRTGSPFYLGLANPDTGELFTREPDFVRWLCANAAITQATLFQRISTYRKLLSLGYPLDEVFELVVQRPFAIRETLNLIAEWTPDGHIERIIPSVAASLQERFPIPEAQGLVDSYVENPTPEALNALTPVLQRQISQLVEGVAYDSNTKQALDFVRHDVLGKPEIKYRIDHGGVLVAMIISKSYDEEGNIYEQRTEIPFTPPTDDITPFLFADLLERLPITNRLEVQATLHLYLDNLPF